MNYDCGFEKGNNWFRYRTGGILIHDHKMIFSLINSGLIWLVSISSMGNQQHILRHEIFLWRFAMSLADILR